MFDKVLNIGFIMLCAVICYLNHLDRVAFLDELDKSRKLYIEAIENVRNDMIEIKTDVKEIKYIIKEQGVIIVNEDKDNGSYM